ncbi:MAG: AmmeMemoRadiSam system protein B [Pseudomonadota bacterium]
MTVHAPVVAGTFYPADSGALGRQVEGLLAQAPALEVPSPKAVILPHAGYRFSGAVAAAGAAVIGTGIRRAVVLGPSHRHGFKGVALPVEDALATPLGDVPLDAAARDMLLKHPDVSIVPEAFAQEHSIEVELPFLQSRLSGFTLVPLIVGDIGTEALAGILETLWGGDETLIVISTDLTHFLTAGEAEKIDLATAHKIETGNGAELSGRQACGHRPLAAFLEIVAKKGLRLTRLAMTHSGKITGDMSRVVGYGAWMAHDAEAARLSPSHRATALRVARQALESRANRGKPPAINLDSFPAPLQGIAPAFVTLTQNGRLRGCIGSLQGHQPLAQDILSNAVKAGFEDPRFKAITAPEIANTQIEIAILSAPAPMSFTDQNDLLGQLRPGQDGLILRSGRHRGTFLPKVWDNLDTPEKFFNGLKVKAGLPNDHWSDDLQVLRYIAESFAETAPS